MHWKIKGALLLSVYIVFQSQLPIWSLLFKEEENRVENPVQESEEVVPSASFTGCENASHKTAFLRSASDNQVKCYKYELAIMACLTLHLNLLHSLFRIFNQDEKSDETFVICAGALAYVISDLEEANALLVECKTSTNVKINGFLSQTVAIAKKLQANATTLLKVSENALRHQEEHAGDVAESPQSTALPNVDPGLRCRKLSANQKKYLIMQGPHQPKLLKFPQNDSIPASKQRQFCASWYDEYPHVEYSISKDAAFCFICSLFHKEGQDSAWCETGVSAWEKMKSRGIAKKGKLAQHFCSDSHKEAVSAYLSFCKPMGQIDTLLDKEVRNAKIQEAMDKQENREIIKILLDIVKTLARQNIAFRGDGNEEGGNFCQIVALVSRHCPLLERWLSSKRSRPYHVTYMAPESQNEMIHLLADDVRRQVVKEIKDAKMFSVSADTTPDLSKKDQLAVVCRYVNADGDAKERLLSLKCTASKTGAGTADEIITTLNSQTLDTGELCFQSYDFTNSMSGQFNGAQQKLQEKLKKRIPYVPCQGHRTNTVVEHSCNASTIVKDMFNILEGLYVFFSSSTKR